MTYRNAGLGSEYKVVIISRTILDMKPISVHDHLVYFGDFAVDFDFFVFEFLRICNDVRKLGYTLQIWFGRQ